MFPQRRRGAEMVFFQAVLRVSAARREIEKIYLYLLMESHDSKHATLTFNGKAFCQEKLQLTITKLRGK